MKRPPAQYLSVKQASARSGICIDTLYRLIRNDLIPHEHIGAQVVVLDEVADKLRKYRERPEGHITIAEAIKIAGVSRSRMSQLVKDGKIAAVKRRWVNTNLVWIEKDSLTEWMRRRENV